MIRPFGIILIICIFKNIFLNKRILLKDIFIYLLGLLVFLELFVNVGYMFKVGDNEILYPEFVLALLFIVSIGMIIKNMHTIKIKISQVFFIISIILTELYLLINPIDELIYRNGTYVTVEFSLYSLMILLRVIIIIIISMVAVSRISNNDMSGIISKVSKYSLFIYTLSFIEWIIKNVFKSEIYNSLVDYIFGKGVYTVDFLLERGSSYSLQGLSREPAQLSFGLFIFLIIILISDLKIKDKNKHFIIGIVLLIASGSLSGIGYAVAIVLLSIIYNKKKLKPLILTIIFFSMLIMYMPTELIVYYSSRFINSWNVIISSNEALSFTSEQVRLFSITETFKTVFIKRPILGTGLGIPYAYGTNIMIFSSIGILGFTHWFWYYFISIGDVIRNKKVSLVIILFIVLSFIGTIQLIYSAYTLLIVLEMKTFYPMMQKQSISNQN